MFSCITGVYKLSLVNPSNLVVILTSLGESVVEFMFKLHILLHIKFLNKWPLSEFENVEFGKNIIEGLSKFLRLIHPLSNL